MTMRSKVKEGTWVGSGVGFIGLFDSRVLLSWQRGGGHAPQQW